MSDESKEIVASQGGWDQIQQDYNIQLMWAAIVQTHQGGGMGVDIINQRNVRTAYTSIRQGRHGSILEFRRRFTDISAAFAQVVGGQVPPLQQSVDFIHALDDRRYAQFKADI